MEGTLSVVESERRRALAARARIALEDLATLGSESAESVAGSAVDALVREHAVRGGNVVVAGGGEVATLALLATAFATAMLASASA